MNAIIAAFARHRIAPNAMMFIVIFLGVTALNRINTQFLPDFDFEVINISTAWAGASAEDVQEGVVIPLEQAIMSLTDIDRVTSTSVEGLGRITVTLKDSAESVAQVINDIEKAIAVVRLPDGVGDTSIDELVIFDPVADVLIYGDLTLDELQVIADRAEKRLKAEGISQVQISGLPERRIDAVIQVTDLLDSGVTLDNIGRELASRNLNAPAGISGEEAIAAQVRIRNEALTAETIARQSITLNDQVLPVSQLAEIEQVRTDAQSRIYYQNLPAVKLSLSRAKDQDTLEMAEVLELWQETFVDDLPQGAQIHVYNEAYKFVKARVNIILNNGLGGMVLVIIVLFIFLNHHLAWWVAVGVPVSFFATFVFLELTGNSINVISLLGFLIALGVIVDDAIVVGENAYANLEKGDDPEHAAIKAAKRMLPAVVASSVTTISAFLPLLLVGGPAGAFTMGVPIVVIMAIAASLIECFIILPGHLAHSFKNGQLDEPNRFRKAFERGFDRVRQGFVRSAVTAAVEHRVTTYLFVILALTLSIVMVTSGRIAFVFFPAIQAPQIEMRAEFAEGTPPGVTEAFLRQMELGLIAVEQTASERFIETLVRQTNNGSPEKVSLYVQLDASTERTLTNADIIAAWRNEVPAPAGLVTLNFIEGQAGPSTNGISIRLVNEDLNQLKAASDFMQRELASLNSLTEISDDIPLGSEQLDLVLTPDALAMGLTPSALASTLRSLLDGYTIQSLQVAGSEVDLVVRVPQVDTESWFALAQLPVAVSPGQMRPLAALAQPSSARSLQQLRRVNGELSAVVSAKRIDASVNLAEVNKVIDSDLRAALKVAFPNVQLVVEGDQATQQDFFADVKLGGMLGLLLIFIALAWVFESWSWPLVVMSAIPFALTGAIVGHWVMDLELSVLSIYGLFGLSGIVINDSIVLVTFYRRLRHKGMAVQEAVVEASVQRFRAVLLTTLTTVGGLGPLLFETSYDAQFLIPLAAGLAFGLIYGIVLILFYVPAMLVTVENIGAFFKRKKPGQTAPVAPAS